MACNLVWADITTIEADAIVFSANPEPICGDGLDKIIYDAAGRNELLASRVKIGTMKVGEIAYTPAYNLRADYLIHAIAPVWTGGNNGEIEILRNCYEKCLELASELKCKSVALSLMATGIYGFDRNVVIKIITEVAGEFQKNHSLDITIVMYDDMDEETKERMKLVREFVLNNHTGKNDSFERNIELERAHMLKREALRYSRNMPQIDLDTIVAKSEKSFQDKVMELMGEYDYTATKVYTDVGISKTAFNKMMNKTNNPSKYTAIKFCLFFQLDIYNALNLLEKAGWTLSKSKEMDVVVKGCIINGIYDEEDINECLKDHGLDNLSKI